MRGPDPTARVWSRDARSARSATPCERLATSASTVVSGTRAAISESVLMGVLLVGVRCLRRVCRWRGSRAAASAALALERPMLTRVCSEPSVMSARTVAVPLALEQPACTTTPGTRNRRNVERSAFALAGASSTASTRAVELCTAARGGGAASHAKHAPHEMLTAMPSPSTRCDCQRRLLTVHAEPRYRARNSFALYPLLAPTLMKKATVFGSRSSTARAASCHVLPGHMEQRAKWPESSHDVESTSWRLPLRAGVPLTAIAAAGAV